MKTLVIPRSKTSENCCCKLSSNALTPSVKTGDLHLIISNPVADKRHSRRSVRIPVTVTIYSNGFDHYAVLQKDNKKYGNGSIYINLRNCQILRADSGKNRFYVSSTLNEGNSLVFEGENVPDVTDWIEAFKGKISERKSSCQMAPNLSPVIPRTSLLPTLTEEREDEEG